MTRRVECEAHAGASDFDRWGYDRRPLDVVAGPPLDGPLQGDRYGGWRRAPGYPAYDGEPYRDDPYALHAPYPTYRVAGRDADGYLVWPGKLP